ncbi:carbohydrate-binding domain-containing protein [Crenalkalicoccus roseus]|uniref:carbohydrate-binding domain-containing protein n=1 Tax=Crenalkalicoccus roseus TaxID=1485588 RepID=UPI0010821C34|nr:S8 family serine peptidase [Crenalkalicoccus roseus]
MASFNDPEFPAQWQLGPNGVRLTAVFDDYIGRGVRIGIVDTGVNYLQPELIGRYDTAADWDALDKDADALNIGGDQHGTQVALILAAEANNGIGGVGAAPGATITGFRMDTRALRTPAQELDLLQRQWQVDISHNSWSYSGDFFRDNFLGATYANHGEAIAHAAANGRGGLGTVIVRSAGNNGFDGDSVNTHNYQNNRFTITVGATDEQARVQGFSNPGAALTVVAPATATSWAAPLVSGAVAAMLEANPTLGYRDVQQILALSAQLTDSGSGWSMNAGYGWNGGGVRFSPKAGFGLLDARAAVRLAETWDHAAPLTEANIVTAFATGGGAGRYIGADAAPVQESVTISKAMLVERAEVHLDVRHGLVGDLVVTLVSPGGTESVLLDRVGKGGYDAPGDRLTFTLGSTNFLREAAQGKWTLRIEDKAANGQAGELLGWSLALFGAPATQDSVHVYTDRYRGSVDLWPERATLSDGGGRDVLNAAAVSTASRIDLTPGGSSSRIADRPVLITAGTVIENAEGGDGNDTIIGNDAGNRLRGWRGDDLIEGHGGDDTLHGGAGNDTLRGGTGNDVLIGGPGADLFVFALGDGQDWIEDFTSGLDRIRIEGVTSGAVSVAAATRAGTPGTLVSYGGWGDGIFLAHVAALQPGDILTDGASPPPPPPPPAAGGITVGAGPDALVLRITQDHYLGDAQYTVKVNGVQIGGTLTAQALRGSGTYDTVTVKGDWAAGDHTLTLTFLNDAWGGSRALDRNLYLEGATYNGQDHYLGDAQYTVKVNGVQIGGTLTAQALRGSGTHDTVTVKGDWGPGNHTVGITFLNDAWGGSRALDRNLYLEGATYNGAAVPGAFLALEREGTQNFVFTEGAGGATPTATIGAGSRTLLLGIAQDHYLGDAQYTVKVNGTQIGGVMTASALRKDGQSDLVAVRGDWGSGTHTLSVTFLNDLWHGTKDTDRNLYVTSASFEGVPLGGLPHALMSAGTADFLWTV